jgi:ribose/xylose/arabinose/galactoside ABC-type transport system permease subunit
MNTMAGTLIIGLINNGLNLLGVNASWKNVALGLIIIMAVALDMFRTKQTSGGLR